MKILIFGGSGATGFHLVSQALAEEHDVTAFVRDPSKLALKHDRMRIFKGNVADYYRVDNAINGQDAVLSALGAPGPFKRDFALINGIQNIVTAMTRHHVKKFIYQSFLGVPENRKELGFLLNTVIPLILRSVISDHEAKEDIIQKSDLDWTIVRCPLLTNGSFIGKYRDGEHIRSSLLPSISRADVADFMLRQITDDQYIHRKPRIMY